LEAGALEEGDFEGDLEGALEGGGLEECALDAGAFDTGGMEWNLFYIDPIGPARPNEARSLTNVSESR
jgi:hypothetical protein